MKLVHSKLTEMPTLVAPMLAKPSPKLPQPDGECAYEFKWDGIRAIVFWDGRRLRVQSRNQRDITHEYPELAAIGAQLGRRPAILDGEIVALGDDGSPRFDRLQQRLGLAPSAVEVRMSEVAITFMLFDLLYDDGVDLTREHYTLRREALAELHLNGPHWRTTPWTQGGGEAMLETSRKFRIEGVVAKRLDSVYEAGRRSGAWIKIKNHHRTEFVIGGWTLGEGWRLQTMGALLLGCYDISREEAERQGLEQRLLYSGKVGSGFSDSTLTRLAAKLKPLYTARSPFDPSRHIPRGASFVRPELVGEFEFTEWTHQDMLRHPVFKGLRTDKDPRDVVREESR